MYAKFTTSPMRLFRVNTNEMNKMNESINMGLIIYTMSDPKCGFTQAVDLRDSPD